MGITYFAIPVSILLGVGAVVLFIIALRNGQFEDLDTPARRILLDDNENKKENNDKH